jgi:hypothetical protein
MALLQFENILLDSFDCPDDRPDSVCGVFQNKTRTDDSTGVITCLVCGASVGISNEEPEGGGGQDEDDTEDEDYQDDGDENTRDTGDKDIITEWDAEKKKYEADKDALMKLSNLLENSSILVAKNFATLIRQNFENIMATHKILTSTNFYSVRIYKKKMMLSTALIFSIDNLGFRLDPIVVVEAGEEIQQIRGIVMEGLRKVKGKDGGPIQTWMAIHGKSVGLPQAVIDVAIEYFRVAEPKLVIADDELKALGWLILSARTSGHALTMQKMEKVSGRSRQAIGKVVKQYQPYFDEQNL